MKLVNKEEFIHNCGGCVGYNKNTKRTQYDNGYIENNKMYLYVDQTITDKRLEKTLTLIDKIDSVFWSVTKFSLKLIIAAIVIFITVVVAIETGFILRILHMFSQ